VLLRFLDHAEKAADVRFVTADELFQPDASPLARRA